VSFGEDNALENLAKLEALHNAANNSNNSHLVTIPPGAHMLSDMLGPIIRGNNDPDTGVSGNFVDDNIDPELAEALRLSLAQSEPQNRGNTASQQQPSMSEDPELAEALRLSMQEAGGMDQMIEEDIDDELAKAIALSRETASTDRENDEKEATKESNEMQVETETPNESVSNQAVDMTAVDPAYMSSLLMGLPGIDPNDPDVQALISQMHSSEKKDQK